MHTDRYRGPAGVRPASLTVSLAITGAMIAGLIFANPHGVSRPLIDKLKLIQIYTPPPPKPEPQPAQPRTRPDSRIVAPHPVIQPLVPDTTHLVTIADPPPQPPVTGVIVAPITPVAPPPAAPILTDPQLDPRYADALQPSYPAEERRAEHEGRVVVRVLIGVDGRVKQVTKLGADSDAFYAATERQALRAWRFKPATRDGIPVEAWRTMAIRFVLQEG